MASLFEPTSIQRRGRLLLASTAGVGLVLSSSAATAQTRALLGASTFDSKPLVSQTDLADAATKPCLAGPGIPAGGGYVVKSTTGGVWNVSGNLDPAIPVPGGVANPSGNYLTINAFTTDPGNCGGVADNNSNGVAGEMICLNVADVYRGRYAISNFVAEVTNTDPFVDSYAFSVVGSVDGLLYGPSPISTLSQGNNNWQYNEALFNTTAISQTLRGCFIQTVDRGFGADFAADNFALYGFNPQITVVKNGTVGPLQPDGSVIVDYSVEVTNTGEVSLTQPSVTDNLELLLGNMFDPSTGITVAPVVTANINAGGYVIAGNAGFNGDSDTNLVTLGSGTQIFAIGDRFTVTFSARLNASAFNGGLGGVETNTANATSFVGPTAVTGTSNYNFTVPVANTNLTTVKTRTSANSTPVEGDVVTYQIAVTNNGNIDATNVRLTDILPAGLTATPNNGTITAGNYDAGTGLWNIPVLANGATATLTIEGTVNLGQGGNTIVNTIPSPAIGDQPDPVTTGDDLTESVTVKGGTTGTGTINYANAGNGVNKGSVALLDWGGSSLDDGIQNGDVVNFVLPTCRTGTLKATFSNAVNTDGYRPRDMAQVAGASAQNAYNGPGTGEIIYSQSGGPRSGSFTINWDYVVDGTPTSPSLFVFDGEVTINNEAISISTNGNPWSLIENLGGSSYIVNGVGTNTATITKTVLPSHSPLLLSTGAARTDVALNYPLSTNRAGVAFGILLPCDYSDAPTTAGAPAHAFEQIPNASGLGLRPRADQFLIGSTIDADTAPQPGATASGDDALGPLADDEDAVTLDGLKTTENKIIAVSVTEPTAGAGRLQAWIDWNGDGVFAPGEKVATDLADGAAQDASATAGIIGIPVSVPNNALVGNRLLRLRFSTIPGLDATSTAANGEVEDHIVTVSQPQVDLVITKTNTPGTNGEVDQVADTVTSGSIVNYTIRVSNNGPDAVTGAIVTDVVNSGLTCLANSPVSFTGDGVPAGTFTVGDLTGAGITLGTLQDGQAITLTYSCEVD